MPVMLFSFFLSLPWLKKSRLNAFRKSRIFSEYRLAKLLSQGTISSHQNESQQQRQQQHPVHYLVESLPSPPSNKQQLVQQQGPRSAPDDVAATTKKERRCVSATSDASGLRDSVISPSTTWRSSSASPTKCWKKSTTSSAGTGRGGGNRRQQLRSSRVLSATSLDSDEGIDEDDEHQQAEVRADADEEKSCLSQSKEDVGDQSER